MSEVQEDYTTDAAEALDMLGKGYERPVVQFERPSDLVMESESGYEIVKSLGWVKFSADFRKKMLRDLKGSKLSVFICVCLHINENGISFPGIDKIAEETGYDRDTVMGAIKEMEQVKGLLNVVRERGKANKYRPYYVARGVKNSPSEPVQKFRPVGVPVQKSKTGFGETSPEKLDSKERKEEKEIPDSFFTAKEQAENDAKMKAILEAERQAGKNTTAEVAFESALFGGKAVNWPWGTNSTWQAFQKWVTMEYNADPNIFAEYAIWREGEGKYKAMSNNKIRQSPAVFMDTGWPTFLASVSMYGNKSAANITTEGLGLYV